MVRLGFSRARRDLSAATAPTLGDPTCNVPSVGEVFFEIGLVLALHLAVAVAVLLTLDAYGVT